MSAEVRRRATARRAWLATLACGALAAGPATAALGQQPDTVIDAGQNADAAAAALNQGCADMENCDWKSDGDFATAYGPARIIGDVLYNCSEDGEAHTAFDVADKRGESTSISESIALEISLGFLGFEKTSVEFEAFSKQAQSFSTEVAIGNAVPVPAGYKGWTQASMLSGTVTGSAYITQGIHLIEVKNIELQFPGYAGPDAPRGSQPAVYAGIATAMTTDDVESRCAAVGAVPGPAARAAQTRRVARSERFTITVCRPGRRCARRTVTGLERPPRRRGVTATLTRAGRVYASEQDRRGGVRLTQRRTITPGRYRLTMREKPERMIVRHNGRRLHRAEQRMITIVPITIGWTQRM